MTQNKSSLTLVREFHEAFGHPIETFPNLEDLDRISLRVRLLQEELDELDKACMSGNKIEVLDALTDLQYVLDGAFLALGFHRAKEAAFLEVHASNMSKLEDGKPVLREDGKILKGKDYRPPNLEQVIRQTFGDKVLEDKL